jgi:hypothetical protein
MGKTPVVICLLLAFGYQSSEAGQFVSYKVCHGEKREVCDRHPEFDHFEGCTNSTSGEHGRSNDNISVRSSVASLAQSPDCVAWRLRDTSWMQGISARTHGFW